MPPRLARLLAVVVAVVLVAGAFVLRGVLSDDDGGEVRAGAPGDEADGSRDRGTPTERLRVVCDEDLGGACDALTDLDAVGSVEVLSAAEAAAALAEAPRGHDAWVTLDPIPDVVAARLAFTNGAGGQPPAPSEDVVPIASSTLAVLTALESELGCDAPIPWDCLANDHPRPVGVAAPLTALGTVILGHAAASLVGTTGFDIGAVSNDPAVSGPLRGLIPGTGDSSAEQLQVYRQPGYFEAVVTSAGLAAAEEQRPQAEVRRFAAVELVDAPTVGVVVAPWGGADPASASALAEAVLDDDSGQTVQDALAAAGWDGEPERTTGLPDPDVIYALQEELAR